MKNAWKELLSSAYEAGKRIYFNDSSDYEDSKGSDSDDEAEYAPVKVSLKNWNQSRVSYGCIESRILCHFVFVTRFIWNVFLCYVIDVGVAAETMVDDYNHIIEKRINVS